MESNKYTFHLSLSGMVTCSTMQEAQMYLDLLIANVPVPIDLQVRNTDVRVLRDDDTLPSIL